MQKSSLFLAVLVIFLVSGLGSLIFAKFLPVGKILENIEASEESNQPIPTDEPEAPKTSPTSISIPKLDLNISVAPGIIENDKWTLYDDKISWLSTSDVPGKGNVILYGHNRKKLFGSLDKLSVGDEIVVEHEGDLYKYEVNLIKKVDPTDVEAIVSAQDQLTLYTCDGAFDQKRLVVIAKPQLPF